MHKYLFSLVLLLLLAALGSSPAFADSNVAYIDQLGTGNINSQTQDGTKNSTFTYQYGAGNHAIVMQGDGNNNFATVVQRGQAAATIDQKGSGNYAFSYQAPGTSPVTITQHGSARVKVVTLR